MKGHGPVQEKGSETAGRDTENQRTEDRRPVCRVRRHAIPPHDTDTPSISQQKK